MKFFKRDDNLARHLDASGKFGFMNEKLKIIIPPQFTFAHPFEYGFSKVCMKCVEKKAKGSEHGYMDGGEWSVIDKTGKVVKPCKGAHREDQCSPPTYKEEYMENQNQSGQSQQGSKTNATQRTLLLSNLSKQIS